MKCKECQETELIKINKPENVKFICRNGHFWFEDYIDKGGIHQRPDSYKITLEETLFPSEKILYEKVLTEIKRNFIFFSTSGPEKLTSYLIDECNFNKEDIYRLFKKIIKYGNI